MPSTAPNEIRTVAAAKSPSTSDLIPTPIFVWKSSPWEPNALLQNPANQSTQVAAARTYGPNRRPVARSNWLLWPKPQASGTLDWTVMAKTAGHWHAQIAWYGQVAVFGVWRGKTFERGVFIRAFCRTHRGRELTTGLRRPPA